MTTNFNRVAQCIVGPYGGEGSLITGQRIAFKVVKDDDPKANAMDVQIYNCAPATCALFESTDNSIILNAGYAGDVRQLAAGDITRGISKVQGADRITLSECGDGLRTLQTSRVSLSYDGAVTARQIIDDITSKMGLQVRDTLADLSGRYNSGWAFVGPARDAMTSVANRFGLSWSVQNEEIQITEYRGTNTTEAIVISPDTGMIGSPEPLDDTRDDTKDSKEDPGLQIMTLLNPNYEPGGIVVLNTRDYSGAEFRIKRVEHDGDTHGANWFSTLEVVER